MVGMATMTLTEFNQNPSRATRLARVDPVIVTDHGEATFELRLIARHVRFGRRPVETHPGKPRQGATADLTSVCAGQGDVLGSRMPQSKRLNWKGVHD